MAGSENLQPGLGIFPTLFGMQQAPGEAPQWLPQLNYPQWRSAPFGPVCISQGVSLSYMLPILDAL